MVNSELSSPFETCELQGMAAYCGKSIYAVIITVPCLLEWNSPVHAYALTSVESFIFDGASFQGLPIFHSFTET